MEIPTYKPTVKGHIGQIKKAAEFIAQAERPILVCRRRRHLFGSRARNQRTRRAHQHACHHHAEGPGRVPGDAIRCPWECWGCTARPTPTTPSPSAILLIAVGARFDDRVTGKASEWVKNAKIIHIDIDPAEIGKVLTPDVPIVGDVKAILAELLKVVQPARHPEWNARISAVEGGLPAALPQRWRPARPVRHRADRRRDRP